MAGHELFGMNSTAGRRIQTHVMFNVQCAIWTLVKKYKL